MDAKSAGEAATPNREGLSMKKDYAPQPASTAQSSGSSVPSMPHWSPGGGGAPPPRNRKPRRKTGSAMFDWPSSLASAASTQGSGGAPSKSANRVPPPSDR